MENPRVTDVRRALILHRNRLSRSYVKCFNPYESMALRAEVKDLLAAAKKLGDKDIVDSVLILRRHIERRHGLNVNDYQKRGLISRGGKHKNMIPTPDEFFGSGNDRSLLMHMANMPQDEFDALIRQLTVEGTNTYTYLINRMRPLSVTEQKMLRDVERDIDDGKTFNEIVEAHRFSVKRAQRMYSWLSVEYRKEAEAAKKRPSRQSVHSERIAKQAVTLMRDGLELLELIDISQFNTRTRKSVSSDLGAVSSAILSLIGKEKAGDTD